MIRLQSISPLSPIVTFLCVFFGELSVYSKTWITRTAGDHKKVRVMERLSYELYALPLL